jgi:hypothetical protein
MIWPCSAALRQQYFLVNEQYFSITIFQRKPNFSETNRICKHVLNCLCLIEFIPCFLTKKQTIKKLPNKV